MAELANDWSSWQLLSAKPNLSSGNGVYCVRAAAASGEPIAIPRALAVDERELSILEKAGLPTALVTSFGFRVMIGCSMLIIRLFIPGCITSWIV